jgi:glucose-6-phosphate dehydrogenase assembly protein OpcA
VRAEYEQPSRIQIKNDGDYVKISVDCDEILFTRTSLPASEYFVFETLGEASALITGIEIAEVMEGF